MNELIMLVGIPASGKTTIAKKYERMDMYGILQMKLD